MLTLVLPITQKFTSTSIDNYINECKIIFNFVMIQKRKKKKDE